VLFTKSKKFQQNKPIPTPATSRKFSFPVALLGVLLLIARNILYQACLAVVFNN